MTAVFGNGWFACVECEEHGFALPGDGPGQCEALYRAGYLERRIKDEIPKWSIYTPDAFLYRFTAYQDQRSYR